MPLTGVDPIQQIIQHAGEFLPGIQITVRNIADGVQADEAAMGFDQHGGVQLGPAAKVIIDRCHIAVAALADFLAGGGIVAQFSEQTPCSLQYLLPCGVPVSAAAWPRFL